MEKLSIGGYRGDGFTNLDMYDERADVRAPIWDTGLADGTFDWIEAVHVLEHVPFRQVVPALVEIRRLLRPDGSAAVVVPNVAPVMKMWAESPSWPPPPVIFGSQQREGMFHHTAFSPETLLAVANLAGMATVSIEILVLPDRTPKPAKRETVFGDLDPAFLRQTIGFRAGILAHFRNG